MRIQRASVCRTRRGWHWSTAPTSRCVAERTDAQLLLAPNEALEFAGAIIGVASGVLVRDPHGTVELQRRRVFRVLTDVRRLRGRRLQFLTRIVRFLTCSRHGPSPAMARNWARWS